MKQKKCLYLKSKAGYDIIIIRNIKEGDKRIEQSR